ncbi:MAG: hypothetical protein HRU38_17285 [Saccharospirillaceae bacterium]|nr:hypothetical protein [Pseudomonadales bacterium]NRB80392.1 hypothetical protein [Saccharospirillaceae bacterium]
MSDDLYKVPEADISRDEDDSISNEFYVVSKKKFLLLMIFTLGIYEVYWFYKNWSLYKVKSHENIWPVPRAIFALFFTHGLVSKVENSLSKIGKPSNLTGFATLYVILTIVSKVFDRLSGKEIGSPITDIITFLIFPFIVWTLYQIQISINFACNDPLGSSNSELNGLNYMWMAFGGLIWILLFLGLLFVFGIIPE